MTLAFSNGLGESSGDSLVTSTSSLYTKGDVFWVNSATGDNTNTGTERLRPLATLAQAVTNAQDGDLVILMDGHQETITSSQTISERLTIVGAGSSGGTPTVTLTRNFDGVLLNVTGNMVQLRNIKFAASQTSSASNRITLTGTRCVIQGCYFECGANDAGPTVELAGDYPMIETSTFVSTSTTDVPHPPVYWAGTISGVWLRDCIGDGGSVGFQRGAQYGSSVIDGVLATNTSPTIERMTLRNGADIIVASSSGGFIQVGTASGGGQVNF